MNINHKSMLFLHGCFGHLDLSLHNSSFSLLHILQVQILLDLFALGGNEFIADTLSNYYGVLISLRAYFGPRSSSKWYP